MAWGWFSPAWLEYSYYWGLACSIGLVYHGLHYSSSSINKPARKEKKKKEGSKMVMEGDDFHPSPSPLRPAVNPSGSVRMQILQNLSPRWPLRARAWGFPADLCSPAFLPPSDTSISSFLGGISRVFRKQYQQRSSQFRTGHTHKKNPTGEAGEMLVRASAASPSLVPFLPYVLWLLFSNFFFFFFFLSKPAPTSCKPNSLLMPTIKIMNCDGRTPSNEGTSGVLSPPSHTAGDFRAAHSS